MRTLTDDEKDERRALRRQISDLVDRGLLSKFTFRQLCWDQRRWLDEEPFELFRRGDA